MKTSKNVLSLLVLLAAPIHSNEKPAEDITKLTNVQETVISQILDTAIETIAEQYENMQVHTVSQETAVEILQTFANSLVPGSSFQLNGVSYTIAYPTKTPETNTQDKKE